MLSRLSWDVLEKCQTAIVRDILVINFNYPKLPCVKITLYLIINTTLEKCSTLDLERQPA